MSEERRVSHIDIYKFDDDSKPIHSVKLNPPAGEFSRRLEKVQRGVLINMRDDCFLVERYVEEES